MADDLAPDMPPEPSPTGGAPLVRRDESDPYGLEVRGADVVHSDTVGAAELSAEYTADHATQQTGAEPAETLNAWKEAANDSLEPVEES